MALKTKFFKVATAGQTADGREIKESWLTDIAETYDRKEREAAVFLEHYSWYGNYGTVLAVKAGKDDKGRTCLFAQVEPSAELMSLNSNGQHKYPSVSIIPNFAGTGKAYLNHLAQVQDPASVGVESIQYSKANKDDGEALYFSNSDEITLELEPKATDDDKPPHWFTKFFKSQENDDMSKQELSALKQELETVKAALAEFAKSGTPPPPNTPAPLESEARFTALEEKINALSEKFSNAGGEPAEGTTDLAALQQTVEDLSSKLAEALKEQPGTDGGPQTGAGESEFSVV